MFSDSSWQLVGPAGKEWNFLNNFDCEHNIKTTRDAKGQWTRNGHLLSSLPNRLHLIRLFSEVTVFLSRKAGAKMSWNRWKVSNFFKRRTPFKRPCLRRVRILFITGITAVKEHFCEISVRTFLFVSACVKPVFPSYSSKFRALTLRVYKTAKVRLT